MGDEEELPFYVDRAKGGRANCKGCKQKCLDGNLRIAKLVASPYSDGKKMKSWHHVDCLMTVFLKQRPTTKRIEGPQDIGNWDGVKDEDRELILEKLKEMEELCAKKYGNKPPPKKTPIKKAATSKSSDDPVQTTVVNNQSPVNNGKPKLNLDHKDNSFREFRRLCAEVTNKDAYTAKTAVINKLFTSGTDGKGFKSDVTLWCRLLLPGAVKRVYNLKSKQLVKLFARIFKVDHEDMLTDLENGDVAETVRIFHEKSPVCTPANKSLLNLNDVDEFLEKLATLTKEDEQVFHFKSILKQCTSNDLKMIVRLIKGDLRINSGPKHILEAVHPDAYKIFQTSRDIDACISRVMNTDSTDNNQSSSPVKTSLNAKVMLMTPVLPMLAEACKSVEMAMKKCPNGMYSEIKYDGERVQLHKEGTEFKYFSRALKPVMPHKINRFKDFIPKAFPHGKDLILDAEVLMVDTATGKPLPFGTLGKHKKEEFKDAEVCLFVFDCIYYNGEILIDKPMRIRRKILEDNMIEIKNHVMFSEMEYIKKPADLANMIAKVLKLGLEGLVLKDLESKYEPGKRHWLKVKKDYLFGGAMADSADLVVLGAWFGSGKKGGMLSVFLMGCYDQDRDKWLTVTKVHTGHDDKSLEELQAPLRDLMTKISQDSARVPAWLSLTNTMVPDFIAKDPKKQPVWEITGTELTQAQVHTADGISVRFPRVTRIRDDKSWDTATNLKELKLLYKNSKEHTDVSLLNKLAAEQDSDQEESSKDTKPKVEKIKKAKVQTITELFKKNSKAKAKTEEVEIEKEEADIKLIKTDNIKKLKRRISVDETDDASPAKKKASEPSTSFTKQQPMDEDDNSSEYSKNYATTYSPEIPLPNIFKDHVLRFHMDDKKINETSFNELKRHWIAYGGKLDDNGVDNGVNNDVTQYVVHFSSEIYVDDLKRVRPKFAKSARHVNVKWLKASIQSKKLQEEINYSVRLRSNKSHG